MKVTDAWGHDTCSASGGCWLKKATSCDDKKPCTNNLCSASKGCHHPKLKGMGPSTCDGGIWAGGCYKAVKASVNWHEAEKACVAWGGHLTSIHSNDEQKHILGLVKQSCGASAVSLIGLNDIDLEGIWTWSDGSAYSFTNWNAGEPNDGKGFGIKTQDAGALLPTGKWDDGETSYKYSCYTCRRPVSAACGDGKG